MAQTLNISVDTADRLSDIVVGCRVDRAAAVLAGAQTLFTVSGGNILLTAFYGEIMTAIDAVANRLTLTYDVDISANASVYVDTVLGSIGADIQSFIVGRMIYLPAAAGALTNTLASGACPVDIAPMEILPPGHFDLTSNGTTTTGTIRWSMWYVPLEAGAFVVAS
jgi:hypothetical protein